MIWKIIGWIAIWLLFCASVFTIIHITIDMKKFIEYQDKELNNQLNKLHSEIETNDSETYQIDNDLWKLKRDTEYLLVKVWFFEMILTESPFEITAVKKLNLPPYTTIYTPKGQPQSQPQPSQMHSLTT